MHVRNLRLNLHFFFNHNRLFDGIENPQVLNYQIILALLLSKIHNIIGENKSIKLADFNYQVEGKTNSQRMIL